VARNFWQSFELPGRAEPVRFPGGFTQFSDMECGIRTRPPLLGEHTAEIFRSELGLKAEQINRLRASRVI
jgi:crotonobetainyl-CoA:carnitine CoA-transferase CaiB-like acyl-CoA transferase